MIKNDVLFACMRTCMSLNLWVIFYRHLVTTWFEGDLMSTSLYGLKTGNKIKKILSLSTAPKVPKKCCCESILCPWVKKPSSSSSSSSLLCVFLLQFHCWPTEMKTGHRATIVVCCPRVLPTGDTADSHRRRRPRHLPLQRSEDHRQHLDLGSDGGRPRRKSPEESQILSF